MAANRCITCFGLIESPWSMLHRTSESPPDRLVCAACIRVHEEHESHDDSHSNQSCSVCNPRMIAMALDIVELLTYYPADDVLAEIRRVLDDTRVPLEQTDPHVRAKLAKGIDQLLRENA